MKKKIDKKIANKKKDNKVKAFFKTIGPKVGKFLNDPRPIIIVLIVLCILFIVAFANFKSKYRFYSGNYVSDTISIRRINAYFHPKVNSFFSSGATYTGEAKKVYQYRIGYYYEYGKDLVFIKEATDSLETAIDLGDIINKTSYYDYSEFASGESLVFTRQARENLGKLHFMVFASTTKEEDDDFDIEIDCPIDFTSF